VEQTPRKRTLVTIALIYIQGEEKISHALIYIRCFSLIDARTIFDFLKSKDAINRPLVIS
jgi:hypothetical protein